MKDMTDMDDKIRERIFLGRSFITKFGDGEDEFPDYMTDQELKLPQPPLAKAPMADKAVRLPADFDGLEIDNDFLHIINSRKSHRVYTREPISVKALSYLLWCSQGVKSIRGRNYATLRTVPSGGARHPFECYPLVLNVEGLEPGFYHYLPLTHSIEFLGCPDGIEDLVSRTLSGQSWGAKANVVFYYSCVFYRAEWRYGIWAHTPLLMDSGPVTENLYLAATSIGLGGCAIAAVDFGAANEAIGLDGEEETIFYAMPVGTVSEKDEEAEAEFYAFLKEEE